MDPLKHYAPKDRKVVIRLEHIYNRFGTHSIHEDLSMEVHEGEMIGLVGGSGSGKTTLVRSIIMLLRPASGQVYLMDRPVDRKSTRLNSSHVSISYAVFCLKKKNNKRESMNKAVRK